MIIDDAIAWSLVFIGFLTALVVADVAIGIWQKLKARQRARAYRRAFLFGGKK